MSRNRQQREDRRPLRAIAPPSSPVVTSQVLEPQQQFFAVIENLMSQALEVSVLDEGGVVQGLRLEARGKSRPVLVDRVGQRTHELVAAGRARIVPQS